MWCFPQIPETFNATTNPNTGGGGNGGGNGNGGAAIIGYNLMMMFLGLLTFNNQCALIIVTGFMETIPNRTLEVTR